mmetsp:Transcript_31967/g.72948  ORF Transcript_31967/g.72948 Transcript_31967/m.72948 type:complete len:823 (+) Transcript_31967:102-2570(+)
MLSRKPEARVEQLIGLLFPNKVDDAQTIASFKTYVTAYAQGPAIAKRLVVLRGPPGIGKTAWAQQQLDTERVTSGGSLHVAHLAHICSTGDFIQMLKNEDPAHSYTVARLHNEARVRLCMELGITPIYVDDSHIAVWEMLPYVAPSRKLGYTMLAVSPQEISAQWKELDWLVSRSCSQAAMITRHDLEGMLQDFQATDGKDLRQLLQASRRPPLPGAVPQQQFFAAPVAVLSRLEHLLSHGQSLLRFMIVETGSLRRGWKVEGQVFSEQQSFSELGSTTCLHEEYGGKVQWRCEELEQWSFTELGWLEALRKRAESLPESPEPLELQDFSMRAKDEITEGRAGVKRTKAPVPTSRAERMKQRAAQIQSQAAASESKDRAAFKQKVAAAVTRCKDEHAEAVRALDDCPHCGAHIPSGQVFCAECGEARKAPAAKRARVAVAVKQPMTPPRDASPEPQEPTRPASPSRPPPWWIKNEIGAKAEVKEEDGPRPPSFPPNAPRLVTIGDSDDEAPQEEASLLAAVRKGTDACVEELARIVLKAKVVDAAVTRHRLEMVTYARRMAARIRFPREIYLLRGPPGVGKSEYALQQLQEQVAIDMSEEFPARLTHVCALVDFFTTYEGGKEVYDFNASKLDSYHRRNESRVQLAMESGIQPLFVDAPLLRLWELRPYVELADTLGYVVKVVEPSDLCGRWNDAEFLHTATGLRERVDAGKVVQQGLLRTMVDLFEPLPEPRDDLSPIRDAERPVGIAGARIIEEKVSEPPTKRPPSKPQMDKKPKPPTLPPPAQRIQPLQENTGKIPAWNTRRLPAPKPPARPWGWNNWS